MRVLRIFLLLGAVLATTRPLAGAESPQYNSFFVVGDSVADNGNDFIASGQSGFNPAVLPSTPPNKAYYKGRFSNGPVGFEYLWQLLTGNAPGSQDALKPVMQS